jgi:hypothetical protein
LIPLAAVIVIGFALAACTAPRNALGNASSSCFRALAAAPEAAGHEGRFAGVRALSPQQLETAMRHQVGRATPLPSAILANKSAVCLVEYHGIFHAAKLIRPWPSNRTTGMAVEVVVTTKNNRPLVTILLLHPIVHFGRF